jgi:hypothetical protein
MKIDWSNWDHLLGSMPDTELANKIGCKYFSVSYRRTKLNIESFTHSNQPDLEQIDPYLGKVPDTSLAKKFRCTSYFIRQRRKELGISRWRAKQRDTESKEVF